MIDRRSLLAAGALLLPLGVVGQGAQARCARKIATEETFAIPEWYAALDELSLSGPDAHETRFLRMLHGRNEQVRQALMNFDYRLRDMDENGVDMHVLSLVAPGVQAMEREAAIRLARRSNDFLAGMIRRYPRRFAGLATVAPQDPAAAADEIDRAMTTLGLNGVVINSHTRGEYLDEPKFDPILAALARNRAPLYLHPRVPPSSMSEPLTDYGMLGPIWGFAADTGLHALRLILGGAFDRYPGLTVVLGHMGEAIPYWLWRIDNQYQRNRALAGAAFRGPARLPGDYFRENFYVTTSGVNSDANLRFALEVLGPDRIMFAIDYPFEPSDEAVAFLEAAPISDADFEKIACRNAERVFRIPPA